MTAPSLDLETYLRTVLALAAVLALIVFSGWLLKRLVASGALPSSLLSVGPGRSQRLAIVEVRQLDVRRRLVLIRRDNVEHLLLLGATADLVIESPITADVVIESPLMAPPNVPPQEIPS